MQNGMALKNYPNNFLEKKDKSGDLLNKLFKLDPNLKKVHVYSTAVDNLKNPETIRLFFKQYVEWLIDTNNKIISLSSKTKDMWQTEILIQIIKHVLESITYASGKDEATKELWTKALSDYSNQIDWIETSELVKSILAS